MSKALTAAAAGAGLLLLGGCNQTPPRTETAASTAPAAESTAAPLSSAAAAALEPTINASMITVMSVQAQTIWDTTSHAFNDRGDGLVADKLSAKDWAALAEAGQKLRDGAQEIADADHITVARAGETIMGGDAAGQRPAIGHTWDAASANQIQARIDANRPLFARRARALAEAGDAIVKASQTRDVKPLYKVSAGLDDLCDGCHKPFWGTDEPPPFPNKRAAKN